MCIEHFIFVLNYNATRSLVFPVAGVILGLSAKRRIREGQRVSACNGPEEGFTNNKSTLIYFAVLALTIWYTVNEVIRL